LLKTFAPLQKLLESVVAFLFSLPFFAVLLCVARQSHIRPAGSNKKICQRPDNWFLTTMYNTAGELRQLEASFVTPHLGLQSPQDLFNYIFSILHDVDRQYM
jgi:hypothetical protein